MKILVVRVRQAEVWVRGVVYSSIREGIVVFVGIEKGDNSSVIKEMAEKIVNLRIFEDTRGKLHYSVKDKGYQIMCVPNFTLCAHIKKGNRPSFEQALPFLEAKKFFEDFILILKSYWREIEKGEFGEHMEISLVADGPVNIILG